MHDTYLTVTGNLVDDPKLRRTKSGHWVANFRVASTPRKFDREQQAWLDGPTLYVNVSAWRGLGENAFGSLHRGDPVLVYGRYLQRDYVKDEKIRAAYELEAVSIGHDLSRGTTTFTKATRSAASSVETDDEGLPAEASAEYIDFADHAGEGPEPADVDDLAEVDPHTGEVREVRPFADVS